MTEKPARAAVYYDGSCPLCRREIGFVRGRIEASTFDWVDVSQGTSCEMAPGLDGKAAMARFHVRDADGVLLQGAAAFAVLWQGMPGMRVPVALMRYRPVLWVLDRAYDGFLLIRPALQGMARALEARRAGAVARKAEDD